MFIEVRGSGAAAPPPPGRVPPGRVPLPLPLGRVEVGEGCWGSWRRAGGEEPVRAYSCPFQPLSNGCEHLVHPCPAERDDVFSMSFSGFLLNKECVKQKRVIFE